MLKQEAQRELRRLSVDLYMTQYEDILNFFSLLRPWQQPEKLAMSIKDPTDSHLPGLVRDLNAGPLAP